MINCLKNYYNKLLFFLRPCSTNVVIMHVVPLNDKYIYSTATGHFFLYLISICQTTITININGWSRYIIWLRQEKQPKLPVITFVNKKCKPTTKTLSLNKKGMPFYSTTTDKSTMCLFSSSLFGRKRETRKENKQVCKCKLSWLQKY